MKINSETETLVPIWVKPKVKEMVLREKHKRCIESSKTITYSDLLLELIKNK